MEKKIIGVIPPIITPVDGNEKVDENALRQLIDHCIENGIHGIFVCGSNGECMSLTQDERDRAIRISIDECRSKVPVMAGCMDTSTKRVIENIKRFEDMGGETAVVTSVFYARHATQDETVRHFEEISRNTSCNLMIYNIPMFTNLNLSPETIIRISKLDKIIGIKDSSGNFKISSSFFSISTAPIFWCIRARQVWRYPACLWAQTVLFLLLPRCFPFPTSRFTRREKPVILKSAQNGASCLMRYVSFIPWQRARPRAQNMP